MQELTSLVVRARTGDLAAYAAIVRRFQDMAYGFAYSYLGDFHLAQDASHEAFVEAYRDLAKLREPAAFPGCAHCFKPKVDAAFPKRGRTACRREPPCGLHVIGAERQWSRRIDDHLRSRAGRQGEPGSSRFFLSVDDELMGRMDDGLRDRVRRAVQEGAGIEDKGISEAIKHAQDKHEQRTLMRVMSAGPPSQQPPRSDP